MSSLTIIFPLFSGLFPHSLPSSSSSHPSPTVSLICPGVIDSSQFVRLSSSWLWVCVISSFFACLPPPPFIIVVFVFPSLHHPHCHCGLGIASPSHQVIIMVMVWVVSTSWGLILLGIVWGWEARKCAMTNVIAHFCNAPDGPPTYWVPHPHPFDKGGQLHQCSYCHCLRPVSRAHVVLVPFG